MKSVLSLHEKGDSFSIVAERLREGPRQLYCLAAHSTIGKMVGLSADQIRDSRLGTAVDPKTDLLLRFARKVTESRGRVSDWDIKEVREAGLDDGAIAEVVANVALNVFTNYFNNVAETEVDFPKAAELNVASR